MSVMSLSKIKRQKKEKADSSSSKVWSRNGSQVGNSVNFQQPYQCAVCKGTFDDIDNLNLHVMAHYGKPTSSCKLCGKEFPNKCFRNAHMKTHSAKPFQCDHCGYACNQEYKLQDHLKKNHNEETLYQCLVCYKIFKDRANLKQHEKSHFEGKTVVCNMCGLMFETANALTLHTKEVHLDKMPYICFLCKATFSEEMDHVNHLRTHLVGDDLALQPRLHTDYPPDASGTSSADQHYYLTELLKTLNQKPYEVEGYSQPTSSDSSRDLMSSPLSTGPTPDTVLRSCTQEPYRESGAGLQSPNKPEDCSLDKSKRTMSPLDSKHEASTTERSSLSEGDSSEEEFEDERPYKCCVCEKKYNRYSRLAEHLRTHTGDKRNTCEVCLKTFSQRAQLRIHRRLHTGERPYECMICGKAFNQVGYLQLHTKRHTGEDLPYQCIICTKTFMSKTSLNLHLRIHTGEKPYTCHVCHASFTQKGNCERHVLTHHKTE